VLGTWAWADASPFPKSGATARVLGSQSTASRPASPPMFVWLGRRGTQAIGWPARARKTMSRTRPPSHFISLRSLIACAHSEMRPELSRHHF
jgi:hypothetical protein